MRENDRNNKTQMVFADTHAGMMPMTIKGTNPDPHNDGIDFYE